MSNRRLSHISPAGVNRPALRSSEALVTLSPLVQVRPHRPQAPNRECAGTCPCISDAWQVPHTPETCHDSVFLHGRSRQGTALFGSLSRLCCSLPSTNSCTLLSFLPRTFTLGARRGWFISVTKTMQTICKDIDDPYKHLQYYQLETALTAKLLI